MPRIDKTQIASPPDGDLKVAATDYWDEGEADLKVCSYVYVWASGSARGLILFALGGPPDAVDG